MDAFNRLGIELVDMKFEGVDTTPQYRERLFWLQSGRAAPGEVLRMETIKETAKELAKSPGASIGAGMVIIPPIFSQTSPTMSAPPAILVVCPNCQAQVPTTSKFCPNCGSGFTETPTTPAQIPAKACPKCSEKVSTIASFCPNCGTKLLT